MSDLVAVLPILDAAWGYECLETITRADSSLGLLETERDLGSLIVVDNTRHGDLAVTPDAERYRDPDGHNLGVARSWNVGVRAMYDRGADYVLLISASMRFGPILHTTFVRQMRTFWGADVIECDGHSWHLIAIHRRCFDEVGLFDERYYPAYEESIDWCYRLRLVGREGGWPHVWVNAMSAGAAWHARLVACPNAPLRAEYERKWGGPKGREQFTTPYDLDVGLDYCEPAPSIPDLAAAYGLGEYGVGWW